MDDKRSSYGDDRAVTRRRESCAAWCDTLRVTLFDANGVRIWHVALTLLSPPLPYRSLSPPPTSTPPSSLPFVAFQPRPPSTPALYSSRCPFNTTVATAFSNPPLSGSVPPVLNVSRAGPHYIWWPSRYAKLVGRQHHASGPLFCFDDDDDVLFGCASVEFSRDEKTAPTRKEGRRHTR